MKSERGFEIALREALADTDTADEPEGHPDADVLARLKSASLAADEADRVRDHLASCPPCTERMLDRSDEASTQETLAVTDEEVAAGVARTLAAVRDARPPATIGRFSRHSWWQLVAAMLAVCCVGLASYALRLRGQITAVAPPRVVAQRPIADVPIIDLLPPGALRGSSDAGIDDVREARIDGGLPFQTLILTPPLPRPRGRATLRIEDQAGRESWQGPLQANEDGSFALGIPADFLPPGRYDLILSVPSGEAGEPLTSTVRYRLVVHVSQSR